jgi:hypothetical protein
MPVLIEAHISGDLATVLPGYEETVAPVDESRMLHICAPADDGFTTEAFESALRPRRYWISARAARKGIVVDEALTDRDLSWEAFLSARRKFYEKCQQGVAARTPARNSDAGARPPAARGRPWPDPLRFGDPHQGRWAASGLPSHAPLALADTATKPPTGGTGAPEHSGRRLDTEEER